MFSSGRLYRALTWLSLEKGIVFPDRDRVLSLLGEAPLEIVAESDSFRVEVDGVEPGSVLYSTRVTGEIHHVSDDPEVRLAVLSLQRSLPTDRPVFAEGRDMGTVVFPDAPLKFFLTASVEERARRRQLEFRDSLGEELSVEEVRERLVTRDKFDSEREVSPLKAAPDAELIDTTTLTVEEVVSKIMERIPQDWSRGPTGSTS